MLAPLPELTFAQRIRRIYKVQFMLCIGTLKQVTEPSSLRPSIAGKVEYDRDALDKRAQTCGPSAFFNLEDYSTNSRTSVISPGKRRSKNSSWTSRTASSRWAKSLARVDFPAAILPHKKINFAEEVLMFLRLARQRLGCQHPRCSVEGAASARREYLEV